MILIQVCQVHLFMGGIALYAMGIVQSQIDNLRLRTVK